MQHAVLSLFAYHICITPLMDEFDLSSLVVCCCALAGYNVAQAACSSMPRCHRARSRSSSGSGRVPSTMLAAMMHEAAPSWVARHLSPVKDDAASTTLAIQTLRNTMLVSIFMGTVSFGQGYTCLQSISLAEGAGSGSTSQSARLLILAALNLGSFLNFALVIRAASHLGYMLGGVQQLRRAPLPAAKLELAEAKPLVSDAGEGSRATAPADAPPPPEPAAADWKLRAYMTSLARMQALHFSLGFRCLYCAIPFAFYTAGPIALLVSTVVMLLFLGYIDYGSGECWGGPDFSP